MIPDDRTSIIPKIRCIELAMGIRTQANVLVVSGTSGYRAGYATDQQPDRGRNPMIDFLVQIKLQITTWRYVPPFPWWFPIRASVLPIRAEIIQQVMDDTQ
jgi:hypothetical protein